jgi:cation:H+ antiporter
LCFIVYAIKNARTSSEDIGIPAKDLDKKRSFFYIVLGLTALLSGSYIIVGSAVALARYFGISEVIIGLSVIAIGTSLPELTASLVASKKGESDISVGNVLGSNLFNLLAIVGIVCIVKPITIEANVMMISMPFLLIYTLLLAPVLKSGLKISRLEGAVLIAGFASYLILIYNSP